MSQSAAKAEDLKKVQLSLDTWAVIISLLAALLIRTGIITRVPW
ncbi:MAG TPA: hypothetical protein VII25_05475 [Candidatus Acidoferrum sp.]|jgi:hypothetical protein